jgi:hypothetical protein
MAKNLEFVAWCTEQPCCNGGRASLDPIQAALSSVSASDIMLRIDPASWPAGGVIHLLRRRHRRANESTRGNILPDCLGPARG